MTDLISRLREQSRRGYWPLLGDEAADEIERLRAALQGIVDDYCDRFDMNSPSTNPGMKYVVAEARAALKEKP